MVILVSVVVSHLRDISGRAPSSVYCVLNIILVSYYMYVTLVAVCCDICLVVSYLYGTDYVVIIMQS